MLGRTILTSGATALSLLGLLIYGVGTIWDFAAAMLVGIISGTYSTWCIASPMTISLQGVRSPFSTGTPQMGSYERPLVLLSPEFTFRPPRLAAPDPAVCKRGAALAHPVTAVTVREALPLVGTALDTPGAYGPLRRNDSGSRGSLACHLRGAGLRRVHRRVLRRAERPLRSKQQARAEQQGAGGLPGEEEASHVRGICNATAKPQQRPVRPPARQARSGAGFVLTGAAPRRTLVAEFIRDLKRTHSCGELTAKDVGKEVVLFGWVHNRRDHGGAVFIDMRDRAGVTQVVFEAEAGKELHDLAQELRYEFCIGVRGKIVSRGGNVNPRLVTGEIEVHAAQLAIFNRSETPPFLIEDKIDTAEDKRLHYRYLDLRRAPLQQTLMKRSEMNAVTRQTMSRLGFLELETPFHVKYTPGDARNFLVPARARPGRAS